MTGDNNTQGAAAGHGSSFTKAFLMGLVVGVIVGGFAGAFLPPVIEGMRPVIKDTRGTSKPKTPRDETRDPAPPVPTDGAAPKPEEKPDEKKPETPGGTGDASKPNG